MDLQAARRHKPKLRLGLLMSRGMAIIPDVNKITYRSIIVCSTNYKQQNGRLIIGGVLRQLLHINSRG